MSREWKPGDVAMTAKSTVALCHNGGQMIDQGGAPWSDERFPDNLRPLVVIDPEDREQVERLTDAYEDHRPESSDLVGHMQAALREFANPTPPKPDEPQGRYAVVLDADDVEWLRDRDGTWCYVTQQRPGMTRWRMKKWADIAAVRVLSEGVTQ